MPFLEISGRSHHYVLSGEGQSVLMVHELGGSTHSWTQVVDGIGDGVASLRVDLRGAGESEKPRVGFTTSELADDLASIILRLKMRRPIHLLGAAAGNAVLLQLVRKHGDWISSYTACNPAFGADADRKVYLRQRADRAEAFGMRAVVDEMLEKSWPNGIDGDRQSYRLRLMSADPVSFAFANRALADTELTLPASESRCPIYLLAGTQDLLRPLGSIYALRSAFPNASVLEVEAGHLMAMQNCRAVSEHLRAIMENRK